MAVVTGSSRGIGAATGRLLAANGVKVVVNGRDQASIDSTVATIRAEGGQAIGVAAAGTDFAASKHLRRQAEDAFGPVSILGAFRGGRGSPRPPSRSRRKSGGAL